MPDQAILKTVTGCLDRQKRGAHQYRTFAGVGGGGKGAGGGCGSERVEPREPRS